MVIDSGKTPVLYSIGTILSYKIDQKYYKNIHYVWCTTKFNSNLQPPTSNPQTIIRRYLEQITTGDRHAVEIINNKTGLIKGAAFKLSGGVINSNQYDEICSIISVAEYESFFPIIYIVYSEKVKDKCIEVKRKERASDDSVEYIISDLKDDEYTIINLKDALHGIVTAVDRKAGE